MKQDSKNKLSQMLELIQKSSSWVKDKLLKKTTAVAPIDLVPEEVVVDEDRAFSTSIVFPQSEVGGIIEADDVGHIESPLVIFMNLVTMVVTMTNMIIPFPTFIPILLFYFYGTCK